MTRITVLAFCLVLAACDKSPEQFESNDLQEVRLDSESRISFVGDPMLGNAFLALKDIDSLQIVERPAEYPDFQLELYKGKVATRLMKVGDFPFKAKLYSANKSYMLIDTIRVRPPSVSVSSRFGQFLFANQENYLTVFANGQIKDDLKLATDKGKLRMINPGEYILEPMEEDTIRITSYTKVNGVERILGITPFIVTNGDIKLKDL